MPLANLVHRGYSNSLSPYWLRLECVSVSSASIVWPEQAGAGAWQEHSLFELLNSYKVLVKCSKNGTERSCSWSRGAGAVQTGLLLAALLTPIKTGRLIKSLGIRGINKASNKYDPLTSPHPPNSTKVTSADQPQYFSFSFYFSCSFSFSLPHSSLKVSAVL